MINLLQNKKLSPMESVTLVFFNALKVVLPQLWSRDVFLSLSSCGSNIVLQSIFPTQGFRLPNPGRLPPPSWSLPYGYRSMERGGGWRGEGMVTTMGISSDRGKFVHYFPSQSVQVLSQEFYHWLHVLLAVHTVCFTCSFRHILFISYQLAFQYPVYLLQI